MKIYRIIAVASAAAFIALSSIPQANAAERKDSGKKVRLKTENALLKAELDSLKAEILKYQV